jgi:hypothetical protein
LKILNVRVYGLDESCIRAKYPFKLEIEEMENNKPDFKLFSKLGNAPIGSGHDKALRGIVVQFDMVAPRFFWQEWDTYDFAESISSQSTLH